MQEALELKLNRSPARPLPKAHVFAGAMAVCVLLSALFASLIPLQVSVVTLFLFAGPHNWFELRYFLSRLPVRFGRSRNFFIAGFSGLGFLTVTYISLPFLFRLSFWTGEAWLMVLALWNTFLLAWICLLVQLRGKQKPRTNWAWVTPVALGMCAGNWLQPELFSLALVYIHPLIALWFLDRQLQRTRPSWVPIYRRLLVAIPVVIGLMSWRLSQTAALPEDNGLFWRITQHSGAELLPNISSHLLVSVHLFLEMLHYAVWIVALPLIGKMVMQNRCQHKRRVWHLQSIPLVRHPRGFPKLISVLLILGAALVVHLWVGFSIDYPITRDVYFTLAIIHVMAEAPFLMKML